MKSIYVVITLSLLSCSNPKETTSKEWIQLFNGTDINDWIVKIHHHEAGENFGNTFRVEDGMIKVRYDQYGDYNDQFAHFPSSQISRFGDSSAKTEKIV